MVDEIAKSGFVFTIGLTGHRDIHPDAIPGIRSALLKELQALRERFATLPVELVTGLAQGADTLAIDVALELGLPVRAVLPMPRDLYEADFEGEAHSHFVRLLDDARVTVQEVPLPTGTREEDFKEEASRDALYARLMDYLVRRSNVLVVLWDGEVTGLTAGSSDVLARYLSGIQTLAEQQRGIEIVEDPDLVDDQSDLAIWIKSPRISGEVERSDAQTSYLLQAGAAGFMCRLSYIPNFVLERWKEFDRYAIERDTATGTELTVYPISTAADTEISEVAASIDTDFVRADQLAIANQRLSDRLFKLFGIMAGLMGLTFLLYAKIAALQVFLIVYVALFASGFVFFSIGARRGWFVRHLAFRALAEALRIRFFLVLSGCGVEGQSRRLFQLTSIDRFRGFTWLRDAMRCTEPLSYDSPVYAKERISAVSRRWIKEQAEYFSRKYRQLHSAHERLEKMKKLLFASALIGAVSLIFFKDALHQFHIGDLDGKTLIVFLMGLFPLWLAVWEIYQTKMATRELLWQYSNQAELFKVADRRLEAISESVHAQDVISALAERSLMDIAQWSTHRYHREHEPPTAG